MREKPREEATPLLAFALPVFNDTSSLLISLHSILAATENFKAKVEILVSDNHSEDDCTSAASNVLKDFPNKQVVRQEKNLGFAGNISALAKLCSAKYIWFIGAGDRLLPESLDSLIESLEAHDWSFGTVMTLFEYHNHEDYKVNKPALSVGAQNVRNDTPVFSHAVSANIIRVDLFRDFTACQAHDTRRIKNKGDSNPNPNQSEMANSDCFWPHLEAIALLLKSNQSGDVSWFFHTPLTMLLAKNKNQNWHDGPLALKIFGQWIEIVNFAQVWCADSLWLKDLSRKLRGVHLLEFVFALKKNRTLAIGALLKESHALRVNFIVKLICTGIILSPRILIILIVKARRLFPLPATYNRAQFN